LLFAVRCAGREARKPSGTAVGTATEAAGLCCLLFAVCCA